MFPLMARANSWLDHIGLFVVIVPLGGLGLLLVIGGLLSVLQQIRMLAFGRRTTGTVLGYRDQDEEFVGFRRQQTITGTFQIPRYRFIDEQGQAHEADAIGAKRPRYQIGESVPVIYLENRPTTCMINHVLDAWGGPLMMLAVGLVLLGMSAWALLGIW